MRTFQVSEELYEQLKSFVIDPFDDTPDVVIGRLIDIAGKAKDRWSPFDVSQPVQEAPSAETPEEQLVQEMEEQEVIL